MHPELATELEIKQALSRQGVHYTAESFAEMLRVLAEDPHIKTIRTINHNAYAYITETAEESIPPEEGDAGATHTRKYPFYQSQQWRVGEELPGGAPLCAECARLGEDNTSDGSGSHHPHQYWWSEI